MATATKDVTLIKIAADAARQFVDSYYPTLNDKRQFLDSYYHMGAAIVWNGNAFAGGEAFATFFGTMPLSFYDVQCFDAHPILPDGLGTCSVSLTVSGVVKYGDSKEQRGFSETFVLMPEQAGQATKFKISAQAFRLVSG